MLSLRAMRWYVSQGGKTTGPFSEERIAMLVTWGKISPRAYVCDEQLSNWVPITGSAFAVHFGPAAADDAAPASIPPEVRARRAAGRLRAQLAGIVLLVGVLVLALLSN